MTTREKIAHLLRRFGLGASIAELDYYEKLGVDGAIDRLINYENYPDGYGVNCYEFAGRVDGQLRLNPPQVIAWWTAQLITTQRPLEEKLTLFWHDHFAVSASKVNAAPMMLEYVQTLRRNANGNFLRMLEAISKDPAMIWWLDNNTNVRGKPNENFAREVLELFTMGIGNYTETDIQEAARAFTGWTFRRTRLGRPTPEEIEQQVLNGEPLTTYQFLPRQHDEGIKKILGNEGNFNGNDVLGIVAPRRETARYITTKLWEWFAYPNPEPKVQEKLIKAYFDSGFEIKPILRAIAESEEFWSEKCVRKQIKNPVDFTISLARQLGLGAYLLRERKPDAKPNEPIPRSVVQTANGFGRAMGQQGMQLLYPPDVAGWDWGAAWISSATMIERIRVADLLFQQRPAASGGTAAIVADYVLNQRKASTSAAAIEAMAELFDAQVPASGRSALTKAFESAGGLAALAGQRTGSTVVRETLRVLFAIPEFHFC